MMRDMAETRRTSPQPGDGLLHPLPLAGVVLLLLNDHLLKEAIPGIITGKLSDLAGLLFFPLLLQALWEWSTAWFSTSWKPSRRVLWFSVVATGLAFSSIQLWAPATELYVWGLGYLQWPFRQGMSLLSGGGWLQPRQVMMVPDPTDLLALPALLVSLMVGDRRLQRGEAS